MSRPASFTSEEDLTYRPRASSTPNPPASYLYQAYSPYDFSIEAARAWARAWEIAPTQARTERYSPREPSPDDHSPIGRFQIHAGRGRQDFRRSSARRSTNPAYYSHATARVVRMSEGDELSRALENIDIGLETIGEETAAETTTATAAETAVENTVDITAETGLSSTLSQLILDTTAAEASSSTRNTIQPLTETSTPENELSILSLTQLNFGFAAAEAISSTIKGKESCTTTGRLSFLDDLDNISDRSKEFVVSIHPEFHNPGAIRSTPEKPEPILETYTNEISEDTTVPLDSVPNILWSENEVELLKSLHRPLNVQLDSGFAEMQEAMEQQAWLENEGGNSVPMTPLTHPFRPTKASKFEKANGDVQIMHLEDFSPAERHIPLEILKNTSRQASPSFSTSYVQSQVDHQATIDEAETELTLDDVMNSVHHEDDDEVTEEESDSSVEIILDNSSTVKGVSTSIYYHRKPREMKAWTDAHEASKLYRKSSSGGGLAGANYKLRNVSNFTLGDTAANQKLDDSTNSLPATPSTRDSISAGENRKGKSAAVKIATPLAGKANNSTQKSKSGKEPQSHKRSPSDTFSDLDPVKKGKKAAKTPTKRTPSPKSPPAKAILPAHSASGLSKDEIDCGNTAGSDSDFSIDVNLEDSVPRDRTSSTEPFSTKSLSRTGPSFTSAAPSGSKENDNLRGKATKITDNILGSPTVSSSSHRKVISYASVAATSLPVRRPLEPKLKPKPEPQRDPYPPVVPVVPKASANKKDPTQRSMRVHRLIKQTEQKAARSVSYAKVAAKALPVRRSQNTKSNPKPEPKPAEYLPLDPVIHKASVNKATAHHSMKETVLNDHIEQKASLSYAEMLNSTPPSAAAAITSPEPIYSAPIRSLSELKKGIRRYDEPALTKEKLSSMKAAKAKPAIAKVAMQPAQATASPYTTNAAAAAAMTAVVEPSSRLPIPARTSSIPIRTASIAPGTYLHPPAFNVNDTWSQTTWSGERGGSSTTVGGSGFQPIQKKKGSKRKTGKAATEWVVTPDDAFSDLPRGQARAPTPGANYADERDNERFTAGGRRRNNAGGRSGDRVVGGGGGAGGRVLKDYGEDGKGSIYVRLSRTLTAGEHY